MNKFLYILIIIMGGIIIYLLTLKQKQITIPDNIEIVKDSIIRDSIYIINDSIIEKIKYIEIKHDKEVSIIMSNSDSTNLKLFTEYCNNYKRTTKNS